MQFINMPIKRMLFVLFFLIVFKIVTQILKVFKTILNLIFCAEKKVKFALGNGKYIQETRFEFTELITSQNSGIIINEI